MPSINNIAAAPRPAGPSSHEVRLTALQLALNSFGTPNGLRSDVTSSTILSQAREYEVYLTTGHVPSSEEV